jgi:hypothetical protein
VPLQTCRVQPAAFRFRATGTLFALRSGSTPIPTNGRAPRDGLDEQGLAAVFCGVSRIGETLSTQTDGCEYAAVSPATLDALTRCDRCLFGTAVPEI